MAKLQAQVGALVRHHRERAGLSQLALAEASARSVQMIGLIERGVNAPSFDTLEAFSATLKVPVSAFFQIGGHDAGADEGPLSRIVERLTPLSAEELEWIEGVIAAALRRRGA